MTPRYLLLPVVFGFAMAFFYLQRGDRPVNAATLAIAFIWLGVLGGWTMAVFRTQEARIKALEERLSRLLHQ